MSLAFNNTGIIDMTITCDLLADNENRIYDMAIIDQATQVDVMKESSNNNAVAEIVDPVIENKKKSSTEMCKVIFYNEHSGNIAFIYKGTEVQITIADKKKLCGDSINVRCTNGKYEIVD